MPFATPYADTLAKGGQTANQGANVANSMMAGIQKAMSSQSDLAFKMQKLVQDDKYRKAQQELQSQQLMQQALQFKIKQKFAENRAKATDYYNTAQLGISGGNLKLREKEFDLKQKQFNDDKKIFNKISATLQGVQPPLEQSTTPDTLTSQENVVQDPTSEFSRGGFGITSPTKTTSKTTTTGSAPATLDTSTDTQIPTTAGSQPASVPSIVPPNTMSKQKYYDVASQIARIKDPQKRAALNKMLEANKPIDPYTLFERQTKIDSQTKKRRNEEVTSWVDQTATQFGSGVSGFNENEYAALKGKDKLTYMTATIDNTMNIPAISTAKLPKKTRDTWYTAADTAYRNNPLFTQALDEFHIDKSQQPALISSAITDLKNQNLPATSAYVFESINNKLIQDTRKYLTPEAKVATDIQLITSNNTTDRNKGFDNITNGFSNKAYSERFNRFYESRKEPEQVIIRNRVYNELVDTYHTDGQFVKQDALKLPNKLFEDVFGMSKDFFISQNKNTNKSIQEMLLDSNKIGGGTYFDTIQNMALDSNVEPFTGASDEDIAFSKSYMADMFRNIEIQNKVPQGDIKNALDYFDKFYMLKNDGTDSWGDYDTAEQFTSGNLLKAPISTVVLDTKGNPVVTPVLANKRKSKDLKGFFVNSNGKAEGSIVRKNVAKLFKAVGSNQEFKNLIEKKGFVTQSDANNYRMNIVLTDPSDKSTVGRAETYQLTFGEIYAILSSIMGYSTNP